jgi:hypothetical protein
MFFATDRLHTVSIALTVAGAFSALCNANVSHINARREESKTLGFHVNTV